MDKIIAEKIIEKIKQYDTVVISRHIRPDGDAYGSALGLREVLRDNFPEKKIYAIGDDISDYLHFVGEYDEQISDEEYENALAIVTDCGTLARVSNSKLKLAKELIKIDHHINIEPYGDLMWVEDYRSSASEMIADLCFTSGLEVSANAARIIYTGIVTDTGRFKFGVTGDSMRIAAKLLDKGIDTEKLNANLYLDDYNVLKFRSYIFEKTQMTENGVAYLYIDEQTQKDWNLSKEDASGAISLLDSIKGSLFWIAFIENGDGTIRVRLRSRFMPINQIGEKYRGGGHANASGATLHSKDELALILADADAAIKEYKENNEGWM